MLFWFAFLMIVTTFENSQIQTNLSVVTKKSLKALFYRFSELQFSILLNIYVSKCTIWKVLQIISQLLRSRRWRNCLVFAVAVADDRFLAASEPALDWHYPILPPNLELCLVGRATKPSLYAGTENTKRLENRDWHRKKIKLTSNGFSGWSSWIFARTFVKASRTPCLAKWIRKSSLVSSIGCKNK